MQRQIPMGLIKPAGLEVLQVKKIHFWVKPVVAEKPFGYYNSVCEEETALGPDGRQVSWED